MELSVIHFDTVVNENGTVIGKMDEYGKPIPIGWESETFVLEYPDGCEEMDIISMKGYSYKVAEAIANAGYNKGFKLKYISESRWY